MNLIKSALKEPANLAAVSLLASAWMATGNIMIALAGVVAETVYILFVPDSPPYQNYIKGKEQAKKDKEISAKNDAKRATLMRNIDGKTRNRLSRLQEIRDQLDGDSTLQESWYKEIISKMDVLLDQFLSFAARGASFHQHLEKILQEREAYMDGQPSKPSADKSKPIKRDDPTAMVSNPEEQWVKSTLERIAVSYGAAMMAIDTDIQNRDANDPAIALLQKRKEMMQQRCSYVIKIGQLLVSIGYQMQLVEDAFGLISDEVRAKPPTEIISSIDAIVSHADIITSTLRELGPMEEERVFA